MSAREMVLEMIEPRSRDGEGLVMLFPSIKRMTDGGLVVCRDLMRWCWLTTGAVVGEFGLIILGRPDPPVARQARQYIKGGMMSTCISNVRTGKNFRRNVYADLKRLVDTASLPKPKAQSAAVITQLVGGRGTEGV